MLKQILWSMKHEPDAWTISENEVVHAETKVSICTDDRRYDAWPVAYVSRPHVVYFSWYGYWRVLRAIKRLKRHAVVQALPPVPVPEPKPQRRGRPDPCPECGCDAEWGMNGRAGVWRCKGCFATWGVEQ